MNDKGFTLIELLIVIAIIGILAAISIFGLKGARESGRDATRKSDLELIRSGLEIYRSDCNAYPGSITFGGSLHGNGSTAACSSSNTYIADIPKDPSPSLSSYRYSSSGNTYELCAALENDTGATENCGGSSACGSATCNYKVVSP